MQNEPNVLDPLAVAQTWHGQGRSVALATVIETWGSAPRPVDHQVAADVIASGTPRVLEFGVADETAWRVGLSCGGRIRVYVERIDG
ncbi:XdhC family protein [Sinorhizobium meliloti]|uniref:XdhC family protein n=1 Tax=Rhizobium meliloti TaxID=382 RepID=UPI000FD26BB7|nr:XdhC family protein [Sinorhizobium meliloti]RVN79871.1 XdhC family protein [Sinorhizobium meliloti]